MSLGASDRGTDRGVFMSLFNKLCAWLAVFALGATGGPLSISLADQASASANSGDLNGVLPPEFNAAFQSGTANFYQCMSGQITTAIGNAGQVFAPGAGAGGGEDLTSTLGNALGGLTGAGSGCPEAGDIKEKLSCSEIKGKDGINFAKVEAIKQSNASSVAALQCQSTKINQVNSELSCLNDQAAMLAQQINSLQAEYQRNIQKMEQDVQLISSVEADRIEQKRDVDTKLGDDRESGATGLLRIQQQVRQAIAAMPTEVQQVEEQFKQIEQQRKSLQEATETRTVALAKECFNTRPNSKFRCTNGSKPTSAREYLLCRYQQNKRLGTDGKTIEKGKIAKDKATRETQALETLLAKILGDAPTQAKIPNQPDQATQFANQSVGVLSMADIEKQFGSELQGYNANGIDVFRFIQSTMGACFRNAERTVSREKKRATSEIGRIEFVIKQLERDATTKNNTLLNKYTETFADMTRALTGQNLPLNVSACRAAKPEIQVGCLQDIKKNMEGYLSGTAPQSEITMNIRGIKTNIPPFKCQGVNGCITKLQNLSKNLRTEVEKVKTFRRDYILASNQKIDQFTQRMAQAFSPQSQAINDYAKKLNTILASLGVEGGVDFRPVRPEELRKGRGAGGEEGLYQPPGNIMGVIGSKTQPPLLDVNGNSFGNALSGVARRKKEIDKEVAEARLATAKLDTEVAKCREDLMESLAKSFRNTANDFDAKECAYVNQYCKDGEDPIDQLKALVAGLGEEGVPDDISAELETGIANLCRKRDTLAKKDASAREELADVGRRIASLEETVAGLSPDDQTRLEEEKSEKKILEKETADLREKLAAAQAKTTPNGYDQAVIREAPAMIQKKEARAVALTQSIAALEAKGRAAESAKLQMAPLLTRKEELDRQTKESTGKLTGEGSSGDCYSVYSALEGKAEKIGKAARALAGQGDADSAQGGDL